MPHIDERVEGMISKTPPTGGIVQVEENTVMVLRSAWGSNPFSRGMTQAERIAALNRIRPGAPLPDRVFEGYTVKREGWSLYIPALVHDFVAMVSLAPRQEDVAPMPVNVASGLGVDFNIRFSVTVGEINWRHYKIPLFDNAGNRIREGGLLLEERHPAYASRVRQALRRGDRQIIVQDPIDPFDKDQPFVVSDAAIIRAALRPENIWHEAFTTIAAALNEAALELGVGAVEPLKVVDWLNAPYRAGRRETNRHELMERVVLKANLSLHRFGVVVFDPRLEGITLPEALARAETQRQSAAVMRDAARDRAAATQDMLSALGMAELPENPGVADRLAQAIMGRSVLESLDAQSGVSSNRAPIIQVGDVMSGNAVGGPGGGSSKGGSDKKSGGGGASKKR